MAALFKVLFLVVSASAWLQLPEIRSSNDWLVSAAQTNNTCYVGLVTTIPNKSYGYAAYCTGMCGSATAFLGTDNTTSFFCFDPSVCSGLNVNNTCAPFSGDKDIMGCCCDPNILGNNCNIVLSGAGITPPDPQRSTEPFIACYTGVWANGAEMFPGTYQACQGDCVSIQLNTSLNGASYTATIYTCDSSAYCSNYDILNKCSPIEPGMMGCCCNGDACIDPYKGRTPKDPLTCFAGVNVPQDNYTVGDLVSCDGMCISVQTRVMGKSVTVYQCTSKDVCVNGLDIYGIGCTTFYNGDASVTACCCDDSPNCNSKNDNLTYTAPDAPWSGTPLACWSGFYKDNQPSGTPGWSNCYGDCVSMQWRTGSTNISTMSLYTCDPIAFVQQLNVENSCGTVDGIEGLRVCSCSTTGCLDGTSVVPSPGKHLYCYVGIQTENPNTTSYGSTVYCGGKCGSATANLAGFNTTVFFCLDNSVCESLRIQNQCGEFPGEKDITGCCCDYANACNVLGNAKYNNTISISPPSNSSDPPIACYTGVWINGLPQGPPAYQSCQGDCVSFTLITTMGSAPHNATLYTCDPSTFCRKYDILNKCSNIEDGLTGCCCDGDACIDPYKGKSPATPLICFAGVYVPADNYTVGTDVTCSGKCASVETTANGKKVKVYQCVQQAVCRDGLGIQDNGCNQFKSGDASVTACCCDDRPNCNTFGDNLKYNFYVSNWTTTPLACWNGFYQGSDPSGTPGWASCYGDCASIQWKTSNTTTMTLYTCDPIQFITQLGVDNACGPVDDLEGLKVCSCDSSGCLDGTSNIPKFSPTGLTCYVGIQTTFPNRTYGSTVYCNGKCGSASAQLAGQNTTTFFCMDQTICNALNLANSCGQFPGDKDITGCCCDKSNNCNIELAGLAGTITPPAVTNATDPPIACYAGIWVNSVRLSSGVYQSCAGDCVSIQLDTTFAGNNHTATLYTCDPSTFCRNYDILNKCSPIEPGMTGCCCDKDSCINPERNISPGNTLHCFAGINVPSDNYTVGDDVTCSGKCASVETTVSGKKVKVYQCVSHDVCQHGLGVNDNGCTTFKNGDANVTACCCDDSPNCNAKNDNLNYAPPPVNWTNTALACWNGFYQGGSPMGSPGYKSCYGDCVSIQWRANGSDPMTLYTCDPVQFVQQLQVDNACGSVDSLDGLRVCSCDFNGCLDGTSNIPKPKPSSCPSAASTADLWTILPFLLLTALYKSN